MTNRWILRVDPSICRRNAVCVAVAPQLFALGEDAAHAVVDSIDDATLESAKDAQDLCPTQAIAIAGLASSIAGEGQ